MISEYLSVYDISSYFNLVQNQKAVKMTNFRCRKARMTPLNDFQDDSNVVIYSSDMHHLKLKQKLEWHREWR